MLSKLRTKIKNIVKKTGEKIKEIKEAPDFERCPECGTARVKKDDYWYSFCRKCGYVWPQEHYAEPGEHPYP